MIFKDKTFTNETVRLDFNQFHNCIFDGCTLEYAAVTKMVMFASKARNTSIQFDGPASFLIDALKDFHGAGLSHLTEQIVSNIKSAGPGSRKPRGGRPN